MLIFKQHGQYFDGMRMFVTRDRLGEIGELGKINLQMQIENTVAQVMELYYGLEYQQERLKTIKEAIEISKERLQLAKLKQDAGSGSGIPIIQAQVDINADSSMLINQELLYKNMKINLNS
ncbi:MAG: TolC family protein [Saprospiraceae bacterium]|nr:TolC family protein [Saprospiraceae bacterium]